ncbi:MAG TPA: acyl-CoA dehydrogenase family protein [Longimicrobiales bacterium]
MSEQVEAAQVRELARQFAESELRPHVEHWDRERELPAGTLDALAELGFYGMLVPEEFGGMGFDLPSYLGALEELAWGEPAVALLLSIHNAFGTLLVDVGSDAQKTKWLEAMAAGRERVCFALSEEHAGSDAGSLETRAMRDGDGWRIVGRKKWVTHGSRATLALVAARTGDAGARGISLFAVPVGPDAAGVDVVEREATMGLRAADVVTLELDVRVDGDALIGEQGKGFAYAMRGLDRGRLGIAAQAIGIAQAALEHARGYAAERKQFDTALRDFEAIQFKLADMATRTAAARALLLDAAREPSTERSAMAKLFASETAMWVTTQAVQIFGGYGYMRDYPVEKLMRDAKATEIYEGTNEIQRVVIARALYT